MLVADGQAGKVYELGGDHAFSMADLAAEITAATGTDISYNNMPSGEYAGLLAQVGVPQAFAESWQTRAWASPGAISWSAPAICRS